MVPSLDPGHPFRNELYKVCKDVTVPMSEILRARYSRFQIILGTYALADVLSNWLALDMLSPLQSYPILLNFPRLRCMEEWWEGKEDELRQRFTTVRLGIVSKFQIPIRKLDPYPFAKMLVSTDLFWCIRPCVWSAMFDPFCEALSANRSVQMIVLNKKNFGYAVQTENGLIKLARIISNHPRISILECEQIAWPPEALRILFSSRLRFIFMKQCRLRHYTDVWTVALGTNHFLESLRIEGERMNVTAFRHLCACLKQNSTLKRLLLEQCGLDCKSARLLKKLLACPGQQLEELSLNWNNGIRTKGVNVLVRSLLQPNNKLKVLDLRNVKMENESTQAVVRILGSPNHRLEHLFLDDICNPGVSVSPFVEVAISNGILEASFYCPHLLLRMQRPAAAPLTVHTVVADYYVAFLKRVNPEFARVIYQRSRAWERPSDLAIAMESFRS